MRSLDEDRKLADRGAALRANVTHEPGEIGKRLLLVADSVEALPYWLDIVELAVKDLALSVDCADCHLREECDGTANNCRDTVLAYLQSKKEQ